MPRSRGRADVGPVQDKRPVSTGLPLGPEDSAPSLLIFPVSVTKKV